VAEDSEQDGQFVCRRGSSLISRNLAVSGHKTTVRLEDEMWAALNAVAEDEGCSVNEIAGRIYRRKKSGQSFTSAIRVFLMLYYRDAAMKAWRGNAG